MIGGFEDPTAGTVELGGVDVTNVPPHKRDVNTVFQSYALFPHLTVEKNVAFGLERKKVAKDEIRRRVGETLDLVELAPLAKRRPAQMSGGQQQRVALARALVNRPRALLLDEPLGALDLRLRKQLQIELSHIQREVGITFVHVTHDQEEAMSMADTIAVMNDGRIEQLGGAAELYERPRTAFVATSSALESDRRAPDGPRRARWRPSRPTARRGSRVPRRARRGRTATAPSGSACGPRRSRFGAPPRPTPASTGQRALGHVTVASFLGVSTQYVGRDEGRRGAHRVRARTAATAPMPSARAARCRRAWDPEHTFVVEQGANRCLMRTWTASSSGCSKASRVSRRQFMRRMAAPACCSAPRGVPRRLRRA